jgi:glycosyltransferase involved in cell wall biosynthesis
MIRVTHFIPFMGVGGTEQMVLNLCKYRNQSEFDYVVSTPMDGIIADEIRAVGVPVHVGLNLLHSAIQWADIVNLHCIGYDPNLHAMLKYSGKPYVATLHWLCEFPDLPAMTICTSEQTYQIQKNKNRFIAIPNGVDLSQFYPRPKQQKEEIIITRVCRPIKCALYFWIAMEKVLKKYPQARLWIVGNEKNTGVSTEQVRFWGIRRDIPEILAETDIFAYTPYPNSGSKDLVVMEALAMGIPCVTSNVNTTNESIKDGENGFLTEYDNVDEFAQKVSLLIEGKALRTQMGENAIRIAQEQFDMRKVTERYEAVYKNVLDAYRKSNS